VLVIRRALFKHDSGLKYAVVRIIIHLVFVGQGTVIKHSSHIDIIFSVFVWCAQGEPHASVIDFSRRIYATKLIYYTTTVNIWVISIRLIGTSTIHVEMRVVNFVEFYSAYGVVSASDFFGFQV